MGHQVIIFDFSAVRGLWEIRVKKHKERQKKEKERLEKSSLEKIKEEWNFMLECREKGIPQSKYLKNGFVDTSMEILDKMEKNSQLRKKRALSDAADKERSKYIFQLSGEHWTEFPDSLKEQTHLKEWHINNTKIQTIPAYIALFQELKVLELSKNQITHLPVEIGCLKKLKELNVSFNNLKSIPPELGNCENLEKLDLSGNLEIMELPFETGSEPMFPGFYFNEDLILLPLKSMAKYFYVRNLGSIEVTGRHPIDFSETRICVWMFAVLERRRYGIASQLSNLKQVTFVDVSANKFPSIPICVLRMSSLLWLDMSSNNLKDLPQDIDRLDQLQTLLLHRNRLTYLPQALINMKKLSMLVVSGEELVEMPTAIYESTTGLKLISLKDNRYETIPCQETEEIESERDREKFEKEFMKAYIEDLKERDSVPAYTTKISFSLQL